MRTFTIDKSFVKLISIEISRQTDPLITIDNGYKSPKKNQTQQLNLFRFEDRKLKTKFWTLKSYENQRREKSAIQF
jgi:hypothetical protein